LLQNREKIGKDKFWQVVFKHS